MNPDRLEQWCSDSALAVQSKVLIAERKSSLFAHWQQTYQNFLERKYLSKKIFGIFLQNFFEHENRFLWAENHIAGQRNMVFPRAWDTNR